MVVNAQCGVTHHWSEQPSAVAQFLIVRRCHASAVKRLMKASLRTTIFAILPVMLASCATRATMAPRPAKTNSFDDVQPGSIRMIARDACPPIVSVHRKSSSDALAVLRVEGILSPRTRLVSIAWRRSTDSWWITLQHPTGVRSYWCVSARTSSYEGGTMAPRVPKDFTSKSPEAT